MNKKVSIATLSAFLVATSPAMAVNEANTLYVNLELSLNRTTVGMVIQSISQQTGYEFSYDESILSKEISKVSVRVKNEHIESVLKKVFKNTDISYRIVSCKITQRQKVCLLQVFNRLRGQSEVRLSIIPAFLLSGQMSL